MHLVTFSLFAICNWVCVLLRMMEQAMKTGEICLWLQVIRRTAAKHSSESVHVLNLSKQVPVKP